MILILAIAGCGGSDAPSCQQAVDHFYAAGCMFSDANGPIPRDTFVLSCQSAASGTPANCQGELDDFLVCIDSVPTPSTMDAQCDCSQTYMALQTCH